MNSFLQKRRAGKLLPFLLAFLFIISSAHAQVTGSWPTVGNPGITANPIFFPSAAIDSLGVVYVSYLDTVTKKVNVLKYKSNAWAQAGTANLSAGFAGYVTMALGKKDTAYIAYSDYSVTLPQNIGSLTVKKLVGSKWVGVGAQYFSAQPGYFNVLAMGADGTPYVAFYSQAAKSVVVEKFNGTTWVKLGTQDLYASFANEIRFNFSFTVAKDGTPYVAYTDSIKSKALTVKKLVGNAWTIVGASGLPATAASYPCIALDTAGVPMVVFSGVSSSHYKGNCYRLNTNNKWVVNGAPGTGILYDAFAISKTGIPFLSYVDTAALTKLSVQEYTATAWKQVAGYAGVSSGPVIQQSLAITRAGVPYVAYRDEANGGKLTVIMYKPNAVAITNNTIAGSKSFCGTSANVATVTGTTPGGGNGTFTYAWLQSTDSLHYSVVAGQTAVTLKFAPAINIIQTTYYKRVVNSGTKTDTSGSVAFYLNPKLAPTLKTAATATTICKGATVTFTATTTNTGANAKYQWMKNNIAAGANSTTYTDATLNDKDSIWCILTITAPCATPASITSVKIRMTVNTIVTPSISIALTPGDTICAGTRVAFVATAVNGGTPVYQWKKNSTIVGDATNKYIDTTLKNHDTVSVILTGNAACSTVSTASAKLIMHVNPVLNPKLSIVASSTDICKGTRVTFTATATDAGTGAKYKWQKNGVVVGKNAKVYADSAFNNGDTVTCTLTVVSPCAIPASLVSNKIKIAVTQYVTPSVSIAVTPNDTVCAGTKVFFIASAVNTGVTAYQWKKNGINVGDNSNKYNDSALNNHDSVSCTVTASLACTTAQTATARVGVVINPTLKPTISITAADTSICKGAHVTFTATATNMGDNAIYLWTKNNITVGTNSSTYTDSTLADNDQVTCRVTVTAPCAAPSTALSNRINITVASVPVLSAIKGQQATVSYLNYIYTVTAIPGATYNWVVSTGVTMVSGQGTPTVKLKFAEPTFPQMSATYLISVTAANNCFTSASVSLNVLTSVSPLMATVNTAAATTTQQASLRAYPNPAADAVHISFTAGTHSQYEVALTDATGRILQTKKGESVAGNNNITLNIGKLAQGIYYVRLIDKENGSRMIKVLKQDNAAH